MLPRATAGDDSPVIVEESDTDIERICTSADVAKVAEDGAALGDHRWVRPINHGESSGSKREGVVDCRL